MQKTTQSLTIVENRKCTDIPFLLIHILFILALFCFLGYTLHYADIGRILIGYDDCGNICGKSENREIENLGCAGANRTNEPFLLVHPIPNAINPDMIFRRCVASCDEQNYKEFINRCLPLKLTDQEAQVSYFSKLGIVNFFQEVAEDLILCWKEHIFTCIFTIGVSIMILLCLKLNASFAVCLIVIGVIASFFSGLVFLWVEYAKVVNKEEEPLSQERVTSYLAFAITITIIFALLMSIIAFFGKRIKLTIKLFDEANKMITSFSLMLLVPFLTLGWVIISIALWFFLVLMIESAGIPLVQENVSLQFFKDPVILITRWINPLALIWFINFLFGCQHFVISGTLAHIFFNRKTHMPNKILFENFKCLWNYHLGTISLGSLILPTMNWIRVLIKLILNLKKNQSECCCGSYFYQHFLQHLTKRSYIITAIKGENFCNAGKLSFNILRNNTCRVFTIYSIGDMVFIFVKMFIVSSSILVGIELIQKRDGLHHSWVLLTIIGLFAYLIAYTFIAAYEIIIDALFMCFCMDCEQNDGINKPYFMSRSFMDFVQNAKKLMEDSNKI